MELLAVIQRYFEHLIDEVQVVGELIQYLFEHFNLHVKIHPIGSVQTDQSSVDIDICGVILSCDTIGDTTNFHTPITSLACGGHETTSAPATDLLSWTRSNSGRGILWSKLIADRTAASGEDQTPLFDQVGQVALTSGRAGAGEVLVFFVRHTADESFGSGVQHST